MVFKRAFRASFAVALAALVALVAVGTPQAAQHRIKADTTWNVVVDGVVADFKAEPDDTTWNLPADNAVGGGHTVARADTTW
ncbi:hypothetical protein [Streptomyces sp. NPDC056817]|uniref:hypothetical protein n=1 Tax=Streptomyces sp. NPDC056817 TaxID=3345950 RepID=UPI0036C3E1E6